MCVCACNTLNGLLINSLPQSVLKSTHPFFLWITIYTPTLVSQVPHLQLQFSPYNRIRTHKYTYDFALTYVRLIITIMLEAVLKRGPPLHLFIFCSGGSHYVTLCFGRHARDAWLARVSLPHPMFIWWTFGPVRFHHLGAPSLACLWEEKWIDRLIER